MVASEADGSLKKASTTRARLLRFCAGRKGKEGEDQRFFNISVKVSRFDIPASAPIAAENPITVEVEEFVTVKVTLNQGYILM